MNFWVRNSAGTFILLLLLKLSAASIILLQYKLNKEFITANFCENKYKPQMHCDGRCHLQKQLQKSDDAPDSSSDKNSNKQINSEYFLQNEEPLSGFPRPSLKCFTSYAFPAYNHLFYRVIFHPPLNV
jgi:hypothetical protein